MTDDYELYKMYGQRCKKARKNLGWSCAALAERMNTSAQNISKLENEGIKDIATLKRLGEALGCDLEQTPKDTEGVLGEVGKQILAALIKNQGYLDFDRLVYVYLCGMKEDDAEYEVAQLHRMGMCEREKFTDLNEHKCDGVFITAKGVIAFKNNSTNALLTEDVKKCLTSVRVYEERTGKYDYYKEYLGKREWEKPLRRLRINTPYRAGYIAWLKKNFLTDDLYGSHTDKAISSDTDDYVLIKHLKCDEALEKTDQYLDDDAYYSGSSCIVPGESLDYDIFYLMAMGLNNEEFSKETTRIKEEIKKEKEESRKKEEDSIYEADWHDLKAYQRDFKAIDTARETIVGYKEPDMEKEQKKDALKKHREDFFKMRELTGARYAYRLSGPAKQYYEELSQIIRDHEEGKEELDPKMIEFVEKTFCDPYRWFTEEEIEKFVAENFHAAETPEEKDIDRILNKLNKEIPETLEYYYQMTDERNLHLDKKICELYGLPTKIYTDEIQEIEKEVARRITEQKEQ